MKISEERSILVVDDDQDTRNLLELLLVKSGYKVLTADRGRSGFETAKTEKPDIILADVIMPGMDGYEFCWKLQTDAETALIPVIFITSLKEEQNRARAFAAGAVDYLIKPEINRQTLIEKIEFHLGVNDLWKEIQNDMMESSESVFPTFEKFQVFLSNRSELSEEKKQKLISASKLDIYAAAKEAGISAEETAQRIADFLDLPYVPYVDPENVELGLLPTPFCRANLVLAVKGSDGNTAFILSNPYNLELLDILDRVKPEGKPLELNISHPESIEALLKTSKENKSDESIVDIVEKNQEETPGISYLEINAKPSQEDIQKYPIKYISDNILYTAVTAGASDIHIEPKLAKTIVRFRIDGDMHEMFNMKKKTGSVLISRFKIVGQMDIAERRKPQDGTTSARINNMDYKLRFATTSTPNGESLIIRLLDLDAKPRALTELGMTEEQCETLLDITKQNVGAIIVVGPTGSGKTTTLYSLISQINCENRSLMSIEDPVEYRIPFANQQQVNVKAGVTFEALLKSVVRQDPDIVFLGEIRDKFSASMAMDLASTGHMTLSTLHSSNTSTALFRLERLGVPRGVIADSVLCIVAQRLVKKLCPHCKRISDLSPEEKRMFAPFTSDIPLQVANPVGCSRCNNEGYKGREGIYEILRFSPEISELVRSNASIPEVRETIRKMGNVMISDHAMQKVREFLFSPRDVYKTVLLEERRLTGKSAVTIEAGKKEQKNIEETASGRSILIVDDDEDMQSLIRTILENDGYTVTSAKDGIEAIICLNGGNFDLIISDVDMPNLDGFKLLDIMNQKGMDSPVVFLTAQTDTEDEIKGYELGAIDYIRKPLHKKTLLLRVGRALSESQQKKIQG